MSKGGLAFLNKKTWHTGHIRNIEKVWQAEQKELKEKQRLAQLQKELAEERQIEELRKMQADAGLIPQTTAGRLDWMYNAASTGPSSEEYLLGREYTADKSEGTEQVAKLKSAPGSLFLREGANEKLEVDHRIREDPMVEFLKAEQKERHNILKNPVKMQNIKKAALLEKLRKATKKMKKAQKKKKKDKEEKEKEKKSENVEEPIPQSEQSLHVSEETVNKYGLIHLKPTAPVSRVSRKRSRSPSPDKSSKSSKTKKKPSTNGYHRKRATQLTEEEKEKRLREMMADGEKHDRDQFEAMLKSRKADKAEEQEYLSRPGDGSKKATFISKMEKQVYNNGEETVEDRVKKYQHYRQKGNVERHNFL